MLCAPVPSSSPAGRATGVLYALWIAYTVLRSRTDLLCLFSSQGNMGATFVKVSCEWTIRAFMGL